MAGKIIADTLETGAGADIATSYVVNGSAKCWGLFDGTGTISVRDSLNVSGITDNATGKMTISKTSSMGSANYTTALRSDLSDASGSARTYNPEVYTRASGSFDITTYSNSTEEDHAYDEVAVHGDLA